MLPHHLSEASILAVALWLMLEFSLAQGQAQYRLTQLRPGRPQKPLVLKSGPECPFPYFPNGVAKPRQRNKMIRFTCASGFTLVGNMYSMCEKGRWDTPIPICIRPGCPDLAVVENGQISHENGQAAGMLFCSSGYQVAGSAKTYCNGTHWDRPLGSCRETGIAVQTSCDFEVLDLCGWMNEATHDFDWKRSDGVVSPKALKTGPKYDHTTMTPLAGHFMMVDSAEQFTNETARMLSPVYSSNYSVNACFLFYYHMFGDSVGTLSVYVKPVSQPLDSMSNDDAYYTISGNQRNVWNEGYFDLRQQSENFQIIIEASLGMKFKSDIAIDDVNLLNGDDCRSKFEGDDVVPVSPIVTDEIPPEVPDDGNILKIDSCENRCGKSNISLTQKNDQNTVHCDCYEGCVDMKICCPDYAERCVFNDTLIASSSVTMPSTIKTTSTASTIQSTTTATSTVRTTTPTTPTSTTTPRITTASTPKSTQQSTTTKKSTSKTTARTYNLRPRNTTVEPVLIPMIRTRRPTTVTSARTETTAPTTEMVTLKMIAHFGDSNVDDMPPSMVEWGDVKPNLGRVFLYTGVGVVSFGCVVLLITLHIRRNSGASVLNRLKQKSMKKNFDSTEGFEDVRFLAADEHLDFTIPDDAEEAAESNDDSDEEKKVIKKGEKKTSKKGKQ
ncbi:MAM and LDL-receptor class A domain-containing protein 2-like [Topomyia yanbarensis]|uniref:MAM and LDL-receptor class A domain-containing protein 2-like n=1 Tax=Topomyia yanbarensis TaxID=2498891 RepID=UPI00273BCBDE|nr:MAM and LDL-receptor class A domain-containing protein 2-like [Topomyia yanbarensis]